MSFAIKSALSANTPLCNIELLKNNLKLSTSDDDQILLMHMMSAEKYAENIIGQHINQINFTIESDSSSIELPMGPILKINSVTIDNQTFGSDCATFSNNTISIKSEGSLYIISVTCGHDSFFNLDPELQIVLLEHASYSYSNRNSRFAKLYPSRCQAFYDKFAKFHI